MLLITWSAFAVWYRLESEPGQTNTAVMQSTFGSMHERLVALKNKYDPGNLFRTNANIRPTV